jgi:prepilin-type N-terminal cleavage/methylation domain-containing protein
MMRRRSGFTLVELMVALALIIFIMSILSQAFVAASKVFRDLKAAGDLARQQRAVTTLLRRDLQADHFDGRRRLSDPTFWEQGPPREGFFRIWEFINPAQNLNLIDEGQDQDGIHFYRSNVHMLHFTVQALGNERKDFFSASVPPPDPMATPPFPGSPLLTSFASTREARYEDSPGTYRSQWAEVVWFLRPVLDEAGLQETANGIPLFSLHRRQLLLVPDHAQVNAPVPVSELPRYVEVSAKPDPTNSANLYFNSPISVTMPARRFGMDSANQAGDFPPPPAGQPMQVRYHTLGEDNANLAAADVVVTDVVSFDVQVLQRNDPNFVHLRDLQYLDPTTGQRSPWSNQNPVYLNTPVMPPRPYVFDTWSQARDNKYDYTQWNQPGQVTSIPMWRNDTGPIVQALKITLRTWDFKTETARQVTIIQAM